MSDNQKKYEEAARQHLGYQPDEERTKDFLAGASFAEKENKELTIQLRSKIDELVGRIQCVKSMEKEAHNAAIKKVIKKIEGYDIPMKYIRMDLEKLKI